MKNSRRIFLVRSVGIASAFGLTGIAQAQAAAVDENDTQAKSLGYKSDATKADKAKYPSYAAGQNCSACALYQGKAGDATGPCPLFAGKVVSSKGWCSAFAKKA